MKEDSISRRALIRTAGAGVVTAALSPAAATAIEPVKLGPDEKLRVGILGCGNRSEQHLKSLNSVDNIEVAAFCDILPEKMEKNSKLLTKGKPQRFTNYQEMLAKGNLHAVGIVLPNTLHKEAIIACLQAGKHVLCEKPLTMNVPDCQEVIKAFDRYKKVVQVGTQRRHSAGYHELAKKLREGLIGEILYGWANTFRADWIKLYEDPAVDSAKNWRMKQSEGGAVIYEMGIHCLDVFNWMIDSTPVEVTALGGTHNKKMQKRDSWNHCGTVVRYANGAMMTYGGHLYSSAGSPPEFIYGDAGTLQLTGEGGGAVRVVKGPYWRPFKERGESVRAEDTKVVLPPSSNTTTAQWSYFYESVQGKRPVFPSPRHHLPAIQIAHGSLVSQAQHRHIKVADLG